MSYQFTPAASRAVTTAARWTDAEGEAVEPRHLLFGLTSEAESRAGKMLAAAGLDLPTIHAQWPEAECRAIGANGSAFPPLSLETESTIQAALAGLDGNPRRCEVATEHLLLGLALCDDDTGSLVRRYGLDPNTLIAEIRTRYGIDHSPIPLDLEEPPIPLAEAPTQPLIAAKEESSAAFDDERQSAVRILDAAANRAGEALRVVEDYVRFALDAAPLTAECKAIRHALTAALAGLPIWERLAARDTPRDVGTTITTETEMHRGNLADVAAANLRRLQESLRSLEEFAKLHDRAMASACEQLRYRAYTLQQAVFAAAQSKSQCHFGTIAGLTASGLRRETPLGDRLQRSRLYVLVDGRSTPEAFSRLVSELVTAGADAIQLRDKTLDDRTLLERARMLRRMTLGTDTLCIVNDRPDLALLAEADGVHVGQDEITVSDARRIVGVERLVGVSTHSIEQARQAIADGADYLGVGPTFPGRTKQFDHYPGLELVRSVAAEIEVPAFAIGGITPENVGTVCSAGLRRAAVSGAIIDAANVPEFVRAFRTFLSGA